MSKKHYIPHTNAIEAASVLDSRDIIARIEDLEGADKKHPLTPEDAEELTALRTLADEADSSADWAHGETLIREDEFTDHIKQIIEECFEMPEGFDSGKWPWNNMKMDWHGAASDAKADYMEVTFLGTTYLIRA